MIVHHIKYRKLIQFLNRNIYITGSYHYTYKGRVTDSSILEGVRRIPFEKEKLIGVTDSSILEGVRRYYELENKVWDYKD